MQPVGASLFWTTQAYGGDTLGVTTGGAATTFFTSTLRLSNPVVAGDVLYVLENTTLVAFDLKPFLRDPTKLPQRLTPTSPDAVPVYSPPQLWISGPFAYAIVSQNITFGTYHAYDLR
jgi:hypothetical protein